MSTFASLSADEQAKTISDLREMLEKHGLGDASIESAREVVCNLKASNIDDSFHGLQIKKEVSPAQKEAADSFKEDAKSITGKFSDVKVEINCQVGAGQKYQAIEQVQNINDGAELTLSHNEGEVWLIDFWATWCPPCQKPMAHNQEMLEKKGEDWKKKGIRIMGISIDQGRDAVVNHVNSKGWTAVEHYFRGASNCSNVYGVRGVPHVMLVDQQGYIVFKGHPAGRPNLEEDLEKLAAGEKLTGDGIVEPITEVKGEAAESKPQEAPEGFTQMDSTAVSAEIDRFKEVCNTKFMADEALKTATNAMNRAFCVIVYQTRHLPSGNFSKYENYRVLVGSESGLIPIKKAFEDNLTGYTFSVNNQIREMP